jgi:hypothetical protein
MAKELAPGKMYRPTDVVHDVVNDAVYVVEQFNHRISKWDYTPGAHTFTLDVTWGSNGDGTSGAPGPIGDGSSTDNSLNNPTGIAFDGTRLIVTDTFHNRIRTLNPATGAFETSTGQGGSGLTDFYRPAGIAVNDAETVLVIADELNHRAVSYDVAATPDNPAVLTDPSATTGLSFLRPHGVFFEGNLNRFNVGDTQRGLISSYASDATGNIIDQFGTPGTFGTRLFFPGSGHGQLPQTVEAGFADTRNNIIKVATGSSISNTTGTIAGTGNGQLYYPESLAAFADTVNYVLVANTLNNRVETYSDVGNVLTPESPFNFGSP